MSIPSYNLAPGDTQPAAKPQDSLTSRYLKAIVPKLELAGVKRIRIELAGRPEAEITPIVQYYRDHVESNAKFSLAILEPIIKGMKKKDRELRSLFQAQSTVRGTVSLRLETYGSLSDSIKLRRGQKPGESVLFTMDCDTSAFLFYDVFKLVAKKLGIKVEMAAAPGHVFLKSDNYFFESAEGVIRDISEIKNYYPNYHVLTESEAQGITYMSEGTRYEKNGDDGRALDYYNKGIKLTKKISDLFFCRAYMYKKSGNNEKAIADYKAGLKLAPGYAAAKVDLTNTYIQLGTSYLDSGQYHRAYRLFQEAIKFDPKKADFHYYLGLTYLGLAQKVDKKYYQEALKSIDYAIRIKGDYAWVYYSRGYIHHKLANYETARVEYIRSISFDPTLADAYLNLSIVYDTLGNKTEAQKNRAKYDQMKASDSK